MRIFITGDVHGDHDYKIIKQFRKLLRDELTLDDYLIICGDFGLIWDGGRHDRYFKKHVYGDFPCTILWVDGNHENFDELYKYPIGCWQGGKVRFITDNIYHLVRGEIFNIGGAKFFAFGGAKSTDRGFETGSIKYWWPQELPSAEEMQHARLNLQAHNNTVDYIITHDGPGQALEELFLINRESDENFTDFLNEIAQSVDFKGWYFGHHHIDHSIGKLHCLYNTVKEITVNEQYTSE